MFDMLTADIVSTEPLLTLDLNRSTGDPLDDLEIRGFRDRYCEGCILSKDGGCGITVVSEIVTAHPIGILREKGACRDYINIKPITKLMPLSEYKNRQERVNSPRRRESQKVTFERKNEVLRTVFSSALILTTLGCIAGTVAMRYFPGKLGEPLGLVFTIGAMVSVLTPLIYRELAITETVFSRFKKQDEAKALVDTKLSMRTQYLLMVANILAFSGTFNMLVKSYTH